MNRRQLLAMWIGILLMVGMCVYPPWTKGFKSLGWGPAEYAPIFRHDYVSYRRNTTKIVRLDVTRLLVQEAATVLLFGALIITLKDAKKDR